MDRRPPRRSAAERAAPHWITLRLGFRRIWPCPKFANRRKRQAPRWAAPARGGLNCARYSIVVSIGRWLFAFWNGDQTDRHYLTRGFHDDKAALDMRGNRDRSGMRGGVVRADRRGTWM